MSDTSTAGSLDRIAPTDSLQMAISSEKPRLSIKPTSGWAALNIAEIWQFRDLLMSLAARDLKLRYKQTALGIIWVVLQPLLAAGIFSFVFGKLAAFPSDGVPYFIFSYAGLLGWNLFSNTLTKTSGCLVGNSQLISKVFFPRLVLPLSSVPSVMADFAVAAAMMAVLMAIYRVAPAWSILLLPLWMALLLLLSLGLGLSTAALAVSYRDVNYILPVFTQMLLYASPVAFSVEYALRKLSPAMGKVFLMNPLSSILEGFRWSFFGSSTPPPTPPPLSGVAYAAGMSIVIFIIGAFSFKRMERQFADVI